MVKKLSFYIYGSEYIGETSRMFKDTGYKVVSKLQEADAVLWTGGSDIHPRMYGEKLMPLTYADSKRDENDLRIVEASIGMFRVGVCRGGQLLNVVPNAGSLWQDADCHQSGFHTVFDTVTNKEINVNSSHHQVMRLGPNGELVAYAIASKKKMAEHVMWEKPAELPTVFLEANVEPEVVWYPKTRCLCFQPHPEWGHKPTTNYFFDLIERYFVAA